MSLEVTAFFGIVVYALTRLFSLSLVVQLALDALYRWTGFLAVEEIVKARLRGTSLRWPVAMAFTTWLCFSMGDPPVVGFDILAELFDIRASVSGVIITAMAVTGGTAPFLALFAKFEAFREKSRLVVTQTQAARAQVDRTEVVKVAAADAATERREGGGS